MKGSLRFIFSHLIASLLIYGGYVRRAKAAALRGDHILSIYFHKPSLKEFENCVQWLKKNGFKFISVHDLHLIIENRQAFPKGAVLLTVDDGWQSNKTNIAMIAEKHQVPITIFVSTDPVEHGVYWWSVVEEARKKRLTTMTVKQLKKVPNEKRIKLVENLSSKLNLKREAMTIKQIQQISCSPWITIGAHSVSHPILNNCSADQAYQEVLVSRQKLQNWTGHSVEYFAYPNGDYTEREVGIMRDLGYKLAFAVHPDYLTPNNLRNRYEIPRFEVIEDAPFNETICRMTGVWQPLFEKVKKWLPLQKSTNKAASPAGSPNRILVNSISL